MLAQAFHTLLVVLFLVLISLWLIDSVKRAEKNLERERHLSDSILESLPGIFYLFDSDGRFLRWNKNFEKITGYTADEFSRLHPEDLFRGEEKLYIRARINRVFTEGKSDAEAHLVSKPGRKIPFYFTGLRIDYEGRPHLIGVGNDITGLKSAENELRESEERYRDLYEHAPDMFLSVNASNAEILTCNNTFLVKTGYSREEILGKKVFEIYHPDCLEHAGKAFHQFCSTGEVLDEELILKRQDGTTLDVSLNVKAVRDHTGCIIHSRSSLRDISDRKRMERKLSELNEELARSNADLEQFAYVASHDLQEPLRMVAGFTQLLARRYQGKLDSKADEYIHYAVDGAHRMQNLINDLLEYSRISSRGNPFGEVESSVLLTNAITHLGIRIRETEARITHDALPVIACDGSQVTRVFQNLLDNALKYHGGNQPRIHISATTAASGWQFEVRDNGVGIQPEYRDRIFEIFERLEPKKYPGTGIGLAVCKKIIHRHGGRIWVESIEGSGSTFCFTISRNKTKNERTREV
jgi:PAS domain S-box-containing protein